METDARQVCFNGHTITDRYHARSEERRGFCDECGAETICTCINCSAEIRGALLKDKADEHEGEAARSTAAQPPKYCTSCGSAFPWTEITDIPLPSAVFDDALVARCFKLFENEQYQSAIQNATIVVEERIRAVTGLSDETVGTDLMKKAFAPNHGEVTIGETQSEKEGVLHLYLGAFLTFRNPSHHRFLDDLNEAEAYSILCFLNLLLLLIGEV